MVIFRFVWVSNIMLFTMKRKKYIIYINGVDDVYEYRR